MVGSEIPDASAKSFCDYPSKARAAFTDDPCILALRDFPDAERAYINAFKQPGARESDGDALVKPYCEASYAARRRMGETEPTTLAGLMAMTKALIPMVGEPVTDDQDRTLDPDAHDLQGDYGDDVLAVYIRNLVAAAERMLKT